MRLNNMELQQEVKAKQAYMKKLELLNKKVIHTIVRHERSALFVEANKKQLKDQIEYDKDFDVER